MVLVLFFGFIFIVGGLILLLLAVLIVLNLRSNKAMMTEAENQPGAAASIVEQMRGDWRVTPALASTTQFDFVHLVIGRPGVILLGEGNPTRVTSLIGQETPPPDQGDRHRRPARLHRRQGGGRDPDPEAAVHPDPAPPHPQRPRTSTRSTSGSRR